MESLIDYHKEVFENLKELYQKALKLGIKFNPNKFTERMDKSFIDVYFNDFKGYEDKGDKFVKYVTDNTAKVYRAVKNKEAEIEGMNKLTDMLNEFETDKTKKQNDFDLKKDFKHKNDKIVIKKEPEPEYLEDDLNFDVLMNEEQEQEPEKEPEIKKEPEDEVLIDDILNDLIPKQKEPVKAEDVFNDIDFNKEYLKQIPELVQEATVEEKGVDKFKQFVQNYKFDENNNKLNIYFKKDSTLYNLKDAVLECINNNSKDNLIVKIWFKNPMSEDYKVEFRTICLANEEGFNKMANLLDNEEVFKLQEKWDENHLINVSGDNGEIEWKILAKDVIGLQILDKRYFKTGGKVNKDNGGKFYKYKINKKYEDNEELINLLKRYQIFKSLKESKEEFEINCLVYALKMSGMFSEEDINHFKTICFDRYIHMSAIVKLGKDINVKFDIVKYREDKKQWDNITRGKKAIGSNKADAKLIKLALIDEHYILNEDVQGINKYYLNNYEEINKACKDKPISWRMKVNKRDGKNFRIDESKAHMKSYESVEMMTSDKVEWNFEELKILPSNLWNIETEIKDLTKFSDKDFITFNEKPKQEKKIEYIYYYADTECDVSGDYHKAYCISYTKRGSNTIKTLIGEKCLDNFLNELPNNAVVYFHNLGYDARMFSDFNITQSIDKGTKTMNQKFKYKGKNITFKDSLSILMMKLSNFPKTFGLKCGEKEMFPYNYYTFSRLEKRWGDINEAGKDEKKWDQKQFEENINKLGIKEGDKFDMIEYVKFYCEQDVRILAAGFDRFRQDTLNEFKIDIDEVLTAPSLANKYFEREIYKQIPNYFKYSGIIRAFIQKAIYGGRCMTRDNEKWKIENCELYDYDARSLYPSAMARLYCQTGKCSVLNENELDLKYLLEHTAGENEQPEGKKYISSYVVEIEIIKVNKHLHFPLIVVKNKKTGINTNTNEAEGVKMVVDNITLEDFVKFQNVECKILRGYKWTDKKDFKIRDVIKKVYKMRSDYKKAGNPVQEVYKLIMNSAYGKMIQKPIKDKNVYKEYIRPGKQIGCPEYPLNKYIIKNSAKIKEITQINTNIYLCKVAKEIETFATNTLLGVQVLSMSKRIMNEVMCLAEDIGVKIYYQDTDSMHLEKTKLGLLRDEFYKKYGRILDGDDLGQFHSDFDELNDSWAYKSIFNGKKCYIDLLTNENGEKAIHYRMKGVSLDCVKDEALKRYKCEEDEALYKIYDELFDEKTIKFNLLATGPKMKALKDRKIQTQTKFERKINFKGKKNYI